MGRKRLWGGRQDGSDAPAPDPKRITWKTHWILEGGRPSPSLLMAVDRSAASTDETKPGFMAPPSDAPPYHGFEVLDDVVVDGFTLGIVTVLGDAGFGDGFVVAPDGSRAGLAWEVGDARGRLADMGTSDERTWGVWYAQFPGPMRTRDDARANLATITPALREKWEAWCEDFRP